MVLEKLEGTCLDEYNKLEAHAQELRETNLGTDVLIEISKDAMEEGKRRFLMMYVCFHALKSGFKWFMEKLKASLDWKDGEGYTFMSDMYKGLLDVVCNICPQSYHRYFARHIEANWSKDWKTDEIKKLILWCSWSTYKEEFKDMLKQLGEVSEDDVRDFLKYPLVMNQLKDREDEVSSWRGEYNLYAIDLYNDYREMTSKCNENFNRDRGFEISEGEDKHTVILEQQRCTCRIWDLFRIPCAHVIKSFNYKKLDPTLGIHWWYSKQVWQLLYQLKLQPVRGENFWKVEPHQAIEPPPLAKMVGKPKVKRSREKDEARKKQGEWSTSTKGLQMTCDFCGKSNHNKRSYPLTNKIYLQSAFYTYSPRMCKTTLKQLKTKNQNFSYSLILVLKYKTNKCQVRLANQVSCPVSTPVNTLRCQVNNHVSTLRCQVSTPVSTPRQLRCHVRIFRPEEGLFKQTLLQKLTQF
ncbi:uncharacterized protein [Nicotiana tomentosiformis]|uniref:uncharacterized protein n=1 Tax=Nicotiana tomentosiformis TaxID=4098 RepID=UPI00388C66E9